MIGAHPTRATGFGAIQRYKNDPPGRTIFDCGSITYDYPGGVKMSFTQNVFHPRGLPCAGQYIYVFGSQAGVDLMGQQQPATAYPLGQGAPTVLASREGDQMTAHQAAFFDAIVNGGKPPAHVVIGATAALTAILGHRAMVKGEVVTWKDLGVDV